jgi:hypothetical protein
VLGLHFNREDGRIVFCNIGNREKVVPVLKELNIMPWRHGEVQLWLHHSWPCDPLTPPGKSRRYPLNRRMGGPESVWTLWRRDNLAPTGKRTPTVFVTGPSKPNPMILILSWVFNDAFMKETIASDFRMTGESWWIGKYLEGTDSDLIEVLIWNLPVGQSKTTKTVTLVDVPDEIRTEHLPNMSVGRSL